MVVTVRALKGASSVRDFSIPYKKRGTVKPNVTDDHRKHRCTGPHYCRGTGALKYTNCLSKL